MVFFDSNNPSFEEFYPRWLEIYDYHKQIFIEVRDRFAFDPTTPNEQLLRYLNMIYLQEANERVLRYYPSQNFEILRQIWVFNDHNDGH